MGYLYLTLVAIFFSFGGTLAKNVLPFYGPEYVTLFRFVFGILFLILLKLIKRQPFSINFRQVLMLSAGWIIFGGIAKWGAYLTENYGFAHGPSYGNIITQPSQTIFLTLSSVLLFREKLGWKKIICILLCMGGVLAISWNGRPLDEFFHTSIFITGLFVFSGCCAGAHVLAQKMVADKMDIIDSNLTIFIVSAIFASIPVIPGAFKGELFGVHPSLACILAILGFGFNTGIGFYLNAKAIPLVPFYMVPIIQSTMVIFAIIWGVLFFHESVTGYIIGGVITFMIGLIGLQLLNALDKQKA